MNDEYVKKLNNWIILNWTVLSTEGPEKQECGISIKVEIDKNIIQSGAELCQTQVKLG